ncbi:CBO0543 family protein [Scopulibacillus cellulosilyticus]|uniref:CBO0543 family protein n=1 Tax=Scopulibacillus cellulosilyticus TaxID=2665665 RepID=A0ABW2PZT9_9BACL
MAFLIVSIVVFNLAVILMPKRITLGEIYATSWFAAFFHFIADMFLDVKYDFYGYFSHGVDYKSLLFTFGIYPAISTLFLNFFPFYQTLLTKLIYIFWWTIFSIIYEWTVLHTSTYYYNGWHLWYSALCYPVCLLILVGNFKILRWANNK